MTVLVVMVGPPGAGKTTWIEWHGYGGDQVVSLDELRWRLTGDGADQSANPHAVRLMHEIVAQRCSRRLLTVVDTTTAYATERHGLARLTFGWRMTVVYVVLHTPVEVCLARQEGRDAPQPRYPNGCRVPESVIRDRHAQVAADTPHIHAGARTAALHLGGEDGSYRCGHVSADERATLPWLDAVRERYPWRRPALPGV